MQIEAYKVGVSSHLKNINQWIDRIQDQIDEDLFENALMDELEAVKLAMSKSLGDSIKDSSQLIPEFIKS